MISTHSAFAVYPFFHHANESHIIMRIIKNIFEFLITSTYIYHLSCSLSIHIFFILLHDLDIFSDFSMAVCFVVVGMLAVFSN
jgi:hypothetical protein